MKSALHLFPGCITITISTVNPAADAARYLRAIYNVTKELQAIRQIDDHEDCHTLLELYGHLHPSPDENALKERYRLK